MFQEEADRLPMEAALNEGQVLDSFIHDLQLMGPVTVPFSFPDYFCIVNMDNSYHYHYKMQKIILL